jgi:hypothetical protein
MNSSKTNRNDTVPDAALVKTVEMFDLDGHIQVEMRRLADVNRELLGKARLKEGSDTPNDRRQEGWSAQSALGNGPNKPRKKFMEIHVSTIKGSPLDCMDGEGNYMQVHDLVGMLLRVKSAASDQMVADVVQSVPDFNDEAFICATNARTRPVAEEK